VQVRSCKPGQAISIIETDCQVDFEAPKDYKEPTYTPATAAAAAAGPGLGSSNGVAAGSGGGAAAGEPEEDEGPKFVPFVGAGRRLDGKPASSSSGPPAASAAAAAAARAAAAAGAGSSSGGGGTAVTGSKPGTFVSTGNRLADKLAMDKVRLVGGVRTFLFLFVWY
jgi:ubiquitin fusion degradation protein 1